MPWKAGGRGDTWELGQGLHTQSALANTSSPSLAQASPVGLTPSSPDCSPPVGSALSLSTVWVSCLLALWQPLLWHLQRCGIFVDYVVISPLGFNSPEGKDEVQLDSDTPGPSTMLSPHWEPKKLTRWMSEFSYFHLCHLGQIPFYICKPCPSPRGPVKFYVLQ